MPEPCDTLFVTEDNQLVHEIGEDDGCETFVVGSVVVTDAKLVKRKGRWLLRGTIPLRMRER